MISIADLEKRYKMDPVDVRIGGIASDLARLSSMANTVHPNLSAIKNVLTEIKFFSEWAAMDADLKIQERILSLQRVVTRWKEETIQDHLEEIHKIGIEWSDVMLEMSGLTNK